MAVRTESLPAYYQPPPAVPIQVPGGAAEVRDPAHPADRRQQPEPVPRARRQHHGRRRLERRPGLQAEAPEPPRRRTSRGRRSRRGGARATAAPRRREVTRRTLRDHDPAYTLILLGTNDWHDQTCQQQGPSACFTIDSLRKIVDGRQGLATACPCWRRSSRSTRTWPRGPRRLVRRHERPRSRRSPRSRASRSPTSTRSSRPRATCAALFDDDVHPNDAGYQVMAQGWFKAITRARSAAASSSPRFGFGFRP